MKFTVTTAFRIRRPSPGAPAESDFMRTWESDGASITAFANAHSHGLSSYFVAGSRIVLDAFAATFGTPSRSIQQDLDASFIATRQRFLEETPKLMAEHHLYAEPGSDWPDEEPDAVLLAVASRGLETVVAWLGADVLWHFRDGFMIDGTSPHTLRERHRDEQPAAAEHVPDVLCRSLVLQSGAQDPPSVLALDVKEGDRLVLLNRYAFRDDGALALALDLAQESARELAEAIANAAFDHGKARYVAVAVLDCVGP